VVEVVMSNAGPHKTGSHKGLDDDERQTLIDLLRRARAGELRVLHFMGKLYRGEVLGVQKNPCRSRFFFRRAARLGYADSQEELAKILVKEERWDEAFTWFSQAAEGGNHASQIALYNFYRLGWVAEKDLRRAYYWLDRAAAEGDPVAPTYVVRSNLFVFTYPAFNRSLGLPEELVLPVRYRTWQLLRFLRAADYGEILGDLRRFISQHPDKQPHFGEQLRWLEGRAEAAGRGAHP
jgi:tetratricopeptide (TPR) repeat protein